jgi:hypothetical protein
MFRHAEQAQRMLAGWDGYIRRPGRIKVQWVETVDREQVPILVGISSTEGGFETTSVPFPEGSALSAQAARRRLKARAIARLVRGPRTLVALMVRTRR